MKFDNQSHSFQHTPILNVIFCVCSMKYFAEGWKKFRTCWVRHLRREGGLQAGCKTATAADIPAARENNGDEVRQRAGIPAAPERTEVAAAAAGAGTVVETGVALGRIPGASVGSPVRPGQVEWWPVEVEFRPFVGLQYSPRRIRWFLSLDNSMGSSMRWNRCKGWRRGGSQKWCQFLPGRRIDPDHRTDHHFE